MHLIQIFVPQFIKKKRISKKILEALAFELSQSFGGATAYLRSPALGLWKKRTKLDREQILVFEVMVTRLQRREWAKRRLAWQKMFRQEKLLIRSLEIDIL